MLTLRKSSERGYADHGWLKSHHSFSFGSYHDERHMRFGALRVINEDRVAPGAGFATHGHRDMEIISYVIEGRLAHRDSMGNGSEIVAGAVQRISAGRGIYHSEYNASEEEPVHFLQIWLEPDRQGLAPSYQEGRLGEGRNQLLLLAAPEGGAVSVHQDVRLYFGRFDQGRGQTLTLARGRRAYVHLVQGELSVNGERLSAGDAVLLLDEERVVLEAGKPAVVLVFDLA
ncbi:pirin family protein [Chitinimonas lacunae]|uniref:Pirin family protein n=1 Tax=Chitinimonas lacunae TaxID=1963018 RepID=A0ABV8MKS2_9NEIS